MLAGDAQGVPGVPGRGNAQPLPAGALTEHLVPDQAGLGGAGRGLTASGVSDLMEG
jgi:hypothetical protein